MIRILFAGGCQVSGYPGAEGHGFPVLVGESLATGGAKVEVHTLAYLRLAHRRRLIAKCREVQPDVLVLQLGHFELNNSLSMYLRSHLRRTRQSLASEKSSESARQVASAIGFYLRAAGKRVIDVCLRHPLVNFQQLEQRWGALIADIERAATADAIIATSSSGLSVSEIQAHAQYPERIVLGHPFNPSHIIPLVEVGGRRLTSTENMRRWYPVPGGPALPRPD